MTYRSTRNQVITKLFTATLLLLAVTPMFAQGGAT
ncbi:MAG TPA: plasmid transfer protein, partial [Chryseobacterium sp.]|nr:plasmid transfer protein [Chryseobacterium sp.]